MIVFTRFAPKATFGNYQFLLALISTFAIISIPEMKTSVLRAAANQCDGVYKKALKIRFLWTLLIIPIFCLIASYYFYLKNEESLAFGIIIAAILSPFFYFSNTWVSFLQGKQKFKQITLFSGFQSFFSLVTVTSTVIFFKGQLIPIFSAYLLSVIITNLAIIFSSFKFIKNNKEEKGWKKYGYFLNKINILAILSGKADILLVGTFLGAEALAIYALGSRFATLFQDALKNILTITTPVIAKKNTFNKKKYLQIFILTIFASLILVIISPLIINLLFSSKYSDSIIISQIIIFFTPFFVLNNLYAKHVKYYLKNQKILLIETLLSPIIRISIMSGFIFLWGIKGLALAYGLKTVISLLVFFILNKVSNRKSTCS